MKGALHVGKSEKLIESNSFGFFAFLIVLWVMAPQSDASILSTFNNNGWGSPGLACLVGISAPVVSTIGAVSCGRMFSFDQRSALLTVRLLQDSQCHLSEELKNASKILPISMLATALTNYILGFIMLVTLVFCIGDLDAALESATQQPYVEILLNATQSKAATLTLTSIIFVLLVACAVNNVTSSSRQLWSFARDGGLPFSNWLAYVRPGMDVPVNAMGKVPVLDVSHVSARLQTNKACSRYHQHYRHPLRHCHRQHNGLLHLHHACESPHPLV